MDAKQANQLVSVELELDSGKTQVVKMAAKDAMNLIRQCSRQKVTGHEYRNEKGQVTTLMLAHVITATVIEGDPGAKAPKPTTAPAAAPAPAGGAGKVTPAPKPTPAPAPKPTPAPTPAPTPTAAATTAPAPAPAAAGAEAGATTAQGEETTGGAA